jgi:hypothetical protein
MRKLIIALTATAGLLMFGASAASAAAAPWTVQPTPANNSNPLNGVSCVSLSACVAVGNGGALSWNGSKWSVLPSPGGAAVLSGVACTSAAFCIAVGQNTGSQAAAWSWNGTKWTTQAAYNPSSADNTLSAIRCASATSCEAVGGHGNGTSFEFPLAEAWNGTTWADQSTSGAPDGALASIACESASKCEAVGQDDASSQPGFTALAMGLSGSKWVTQATPVLPNGLDSPPGGYGWNLTSVSCWSTGCTAVGSQEYCDCSPESSGNLLLAESWNGSKWALQGAEGTGSGDFSSTAVWNGVHCLSASACTAVGFWTDDNEAQPLLTLVSSWNGSTWSQVSSPSPNNDNGTDSLSGLACVSGGSVCTAVGQQPSASGEPPGASLAMRN